MSYTALKVKDVHSGVIHKVGGRVKSWHKRWMVLKSDHTLQYFKDASKAPLGTISLRDPRFAVRKGEKSDFNWPKQCNLEHSLVIMTTGRVYYMFTETLDEAEEWKRQIEESKDKVEAKETANVTLPSRYSKTSGNNGSLFGAPTAVPTDDSRTPKQYKKKDRRLPTKRFNSAGDLSGPDSDIEGCSDGELNHDDFNGQKILIEDLSDSVPFIETTSTVDSVYDLVRQSDEKSNIPTIPPTKEASSNTNNNNGTSSQNYDQVALHSQLILEDSICINESLYDLVGRINAGEDEEIPINEEPPQPSMTNTQDLYEPIQEGPPLSMSPSKKSIKNEPLPLVPPPNLTNQSSELYEPIAEAIPMGGVMYEAIDRDDELKEADSSDDETVPLPVSGPPLPLRGQPSETTPPLPPRIGQETYDNAPLIPPKNQPIEEDEFYGNAPSLPVKPNSPMSSPRHPKPITPPPMRSIKQPVPTPRTNKPRISQNIDEDDLYDDTVPLPPPPGEELYDDIQGTLMSTKDMERDIRVLKDVVIKENDRTEENETAKQDNRPTAEGDNDEIFRENENTISVPPVVIIRTTPLKAKGGQRAHSATVGSSPNDAGIEMFHRRAQQVNSVTDNSIINKQVREMLLQEPKEVISLEEKFTLAETLREVEIEKQLASEERFKWERERLKFEEERKKFEEERRRLKEELENTKAKLQQ